jgi:hypothetical protein
MASHDIVCPVCLTPAAKWFEFGGKADPHGYYHCSRCGRSCAVQERPDGQPGHRTPWMQIGTKTATVTEHPDNASSSSFVNARRKLITNAVDRDDRAFETVSVCPKLDRRAQARMQSLDVARRAYELHESAVASMDTTWTTGCAQNAPSEQSSLRGRLDSRRLTSRGQC